MNDDTWRVFVRVAILNTDAITLIWGRRKDDRVLFYVAPRTSTRPGPHATCTAGTK